MARNENPPFERGMTLYNGETIDTDNLMGADIIGKEWLFEDRNASTGLDRTNEFVRCRAVRNKAPAYLLPKHLGVMSATAGQFGNCVAGHQRLHHAGVATQKPAFPVDEYLPAAGCTTNDVCWVVMEGPAVVLTSIAADAANVHTVGARVWAETASSTSLTGTTGGRVQAAGVIGAATSGVTDITPELDAGLNAIGRALSAKTTAETNEDLLINVCKW